MSHYPFVSEAARSRFLSAYAEAEETLWPRPFARRFVETSAGRTFVRISGNPDGGPLLILPGVTTTSLAFAPSAAALGERYRLYAVDTINDHGLSVNSRFLFRHEDYRRWLLDLLAGLGLDAVNLLGWSLGGFTAADFAKAHPGKVKKLILVAPGCVVSRLSAPFVLRGIPVWFAPVWGSHRAFPWLFADLASRGEKARPISFPRFMEFSDLCFRSFVKRLPALPYRFTDADLRRLSMPVLFVAGTNEKLYDPFQAAARLARFPNFRTKLIDGAGHDVMWTQTDAFNRAVLQFLAGLYSE